MKGGALTSLTRPAPAREILASRSQAVADAVPTMTIQGIRRPQVLHEKTSMPEHLSPTDNIASFVRVSEGQTLAEDTSLHKPYYLEDEKNWTIGYGHNLGPNKPAPEMFWSERQSLDQLKKDLTGAVDRVQRLVRVPLTQDQFDALTSLAFNTREDSFKNSRMLKNLNARDYTGAAREMLTFDHSGGVRLKGLTDRRRAEAIRFMGREAHRLPSERPEE